MTRAQHDKRRATYADYLTWTDDQRYELINGIAHVKEPPAPMRLHQELVGELYHQIRLALAGKPCRAYIAPFDIRLCGPDEPDEQVHTVVQPDVSIVCDREKLDVRGMRGAPNWVAEVLSPGTWRHDQRVKVPVYERAGVQEVWLIHPIDRVLTIYRLDGDRYAPAIVSKLMGHTALSSVVGVHIDWERVLEGIA